MQNLNVLIAEDDKFFAELLQYQVLLNPDNSAKIVMNGKNLLQEMVHKPDVVTLDFNLPDYDGTEILSRIKKEFPDTEVIIISGQEDISTAIDLLDKGAYDYIVKNEQTKERLWNTLNKIRTNLSLKAEISELKEEIGKHYDFSKTIIGKSESIKKIYGLLEKAINSSINVSISGETGTGKEVVAKAIHYNSKNSKSPFIAINMSAIPHELIESELFGYEKGAFTGANIRKEGKFEAAKKGTIFLDEIGDLDLNMQAKLLRVLQEREVTRIGSNTSIKVDCRVICASHRNLKEEVKAGNFRQDLFYRIIGLPIHLEPLRNRKEDIPLLAKHFVKAFSAENKTKELTFSKEAMESLLNYCYPGNIRELKSIIELASVMSDGIEIKEDNIMYHSAENEILNAFEEISLKEYNEKIVHHFLKKYNNNVLKVAEILDIGKSTIYRMLKEN